MAKKTKYILLLGSTLCLILVMSSFFRLNTELMMEEKKELADNLTYEYEYSADYEVNGDIKSLVASSDYIVTGHYEKFLDNWDMGENYLSEVYTFNVDKDLKGVTGATIEVAIPHTVLLETSEVGEVMEARLNLPNYNKPEYEHEYVLFLKKLQTRDAYGPASVPFQVEIDSNGLVALKTNTENTEVMKKTKSNDIVHFKTERINIRRFDEVSGKNRDDLIKEIILEIDRN